MHALLCLSETDHAVWHSIASQLEGETLVYRQTHTNTEVDFMFEGKEVVASCDTRIKTQQNYSDHL